jgi:hypothetical protein
MKEQSYKNHSRLIAGYHGITGAAILATIIGAIINVCNSSRENLYSASLILLISLILVSMFFYSRIFGLRAQDRAIRAEENFRHFVLTGKPLDSRLTMSQVIALRFASDAELPNLALRAANDRLTNKQIKEQVKNWRGDYHRV